MSKLRVGDRVIITNNKGDQRAIDYLTNSNPDNFKIGHTGYITQVDHEDFDFVARIDHDNGREYGFYRGELKLTKMRAAPADMIYDPDCPSELELVLERLTSDIVS